MRVNGLMLAESTHEEVVNLIKLKKTLTLSLKGKCTEHACTCNLHVHACSNSMHMIVCGLLICHFLLDLFLAVGMVPENK